MGKISDIQRERELIGCFLLSREAINTAVENNFMPEECVNPFNIKIFEIILQKCRAESEYLPTTNFILDNFNIEQKEKEETLIKLNRYKKMVQRMIVDDKQYIDIAKDNIMILRDLAVKRRVIYILKNGIEKIELPARDFISHINKDLTLVELNDGVVTEIDIYSGFKEIKEEMEYMLDNDVVFGFKTYFRDLDRMLDDCISKGSLTYIVGRPSNYKTGFALNVAFNMAENGQPVAIVSHEMSPKNCYRRIYARVANVEMAKLKKPKTLTEEEWVRINNAIEYVNKMPLFIIDGSKLNIGQIDSSVAYLKSKYGIEVVFEDYFQLIRKRDNTIPTEERDFAEVSEELRMIAKKYDVAVIALSQANRSCEMRDDKRPTLKDIRNTGKAEQDAENILYVYRDEFYFHSASEMPNHIEIGALKVREGELKRALLHFNGAKATLSNCDPMVVMDKSIDYIGGGGVA